MISVKNFKRGKLISLEAVNFILRPLHTSLISLIVIRYFNADLWGEFVLFLVGVELIHSFLSWGQKPYLLRAFSLKPSEMNVQWKKSFFSRIPLLILVFLILIIVPVFQNYFLLLFLWIMIKFVSSFFEALIQYHRKYFHSIASEIASFITSFSLIYFFNEQMELKYLILIFASAGLIKTLVLLPLIPRNSVSISLKDIKTELLMSIPFLALSVAGLLQTKGDLYAVTYFLPDSEIASYQVIIGFLIIAQTFSAIVLGPFQKNIYRLKNNVFGKLKRLYLSVGVFASTIISIVIYVFIQYLYLIDLPIYYVFLFFAYLIPLYFYLIEAQLLMKHENEKILLYFTLIAAIFNVVVSIILVPSFGIVGALLSGIVCRVILATLVVIKSKKIMKINVS